MILIYIVLNILIFNFSYVFVTIKYLLDELNTVKNINNRILNITKLKISSALIIIGCISTITSSIIGLRNAATAESMLIFSIVSIIPFIVNLIIYNFIKNKIEILSMHSKKKLNPIIVIVIYIFSFIIPLVIANFSLPSFFQITPVLVFVATFSIYMIFTKFIIKKVEVGYKLAKYSRFLLLVCIIFLIISLSISFFNWDFTFIIGKSLAFGLLSVLYTLYIYNLIVTFTNAEKMGAISKNIQKYFNLNLIIIIGIFILVLFLIFHIFI